MAVLPAAPGRPQQPSDSTAPPAAQPVVAVTTVQVNGSADRNEPSRSSVSAADVLATAGTYGDFTRYLQVFPGVVFNSDQSNDILVRGGNPLENLYLVDGFEVPNINHITSEATTGGLVSMIDTASIGGVTLLSGGYSASYDERLSSVVSIAPRILAATQARYSEAELGYVGAGGLTQWALPGQGSILLSAHRSLLNLFTNNIGLDGVPTYTNGLAQADWKLAGGSQLSLLSLSGADSIAINPCSNDFAESNLVQTQYDGWRTTNGVRWSRSDSPRWVGALSVSDSEQQQSIAQQQQLLNVVYPCGHTVIDPRYPTLYTEQTHDGMSLLGYDTSVALTGRLLLTAGTLGKLDRMHYAVAQPIGSQSPLTTDPTRSDATSFSPDTAVGESGTFAELTLRATRQWSMTAGGRLQTFALDGQTTLTPRLRTSYTLGEHASVHAAFGEYAQLPPAVYFFAFAQNRSLLPIRARHLVVGGDLWRGRRTRVSLELYRKLYRDYPVSTEYPQLSLANLVDTLGQQFVWLPMTSRGHGTSQGVELEAETRLGAHLVLQGNIAYARATYSGLDGIARPGNFDYPVVLNGTGIWRTGQHWESSFRYEFTTGRPYTPYLLAASITQDRPIYDVSRLNAVRGPVYSRLDFQVDRILPTRRGEARLYAGLNNALDRSNFLGYAWESRCAAYAPCAASPGPATLISQMPLYPNFGLRYNF